VTLLKDISSGCIITTNFDQVIEEVIGRGAIEGYMHGKQTPNKFFPKLKKGERCLLKLHGDAEDPDSYIFTEEQYNYAYGCETYFDFRTSLSQVLRQIFISHSLLFLGCSLEQDKTLQLFKEVSNSGGFVIPDHFAILSEPPDLEHRNRKKRQLLEMNIKPIWYPKGEHQFVEKYLQLALAIADGHITF